MEEIQVSTRLQIALPQHTEHEQEHYQGIEYTALVSTTTYKYGLKTRCTGNNLWQNSLACHQ